MNKRDLALLRTFINWGSQDTTDYFALLRGLAEIAVEFDHLARRRNNKEITLPLGLLVLKWMLYYFPIVEQGLNPAIKESQFDFQPDLKKVTTYYAGRGGYEAFYADLIRGGISAGISREVIIVLRMIRDAIEDTVRQLKSFPGSSRSPLLSYNRDTRHIMEVTRPARINPEFLVQNFGTFNVRRNFYEAVRNFADFLTGTGSIINRWALFTAQADDSNQVPVNHALSVIASPALKHHDTAQARRIYEKIAEHGVELRCIWSGRILDPDNLVMDHIIPFSMVPNNDLWNLMPCHDAVNIRKGNRIPSPGLLTLRSKILLGYWAVARDFHQSLFDSQFKTSLAGFEVKNYEVKWGDAGLSALKSRCRFYIEQPGMEAWNI